MKTIKLEGGIKVRTFAPRPNFDPFNASAAQLARNGFPPIPDDPHLRARYERVFKHIKGKFQYVEPTFQVRQNPSRDPSSALPPP